MKGRYMITITNYITNPGDKFSSRGRGLREERENSQVR